MSGTTFLAWCDECRVVQAFSNEATRLYWQIHHHDSDEEQE